MKPTSLIFLALSVVLFFGGLLTCGMASSMADAEGVSIYELKKDEEGDLVYTYELTDERVSKLSLTFSGVDVTVIGNAEKSYVELENFDVYSYAVTVSGSSVSVDGTVNLMSSMIDLSNGGLRFKGFRYFFVDSPASSAPKRATVYLSAETELSALTLNVKQGSVTIKDLDRTVDYTANITDGALLFDGIRTDSVANLYLENSSLTVNNSLFTTLDVVQKGGTIALSMNHGELSQERITYEITNETGITRINGTEVPSPYHVVSAAPLSLIRIDTDVAEIVIEEFITSPDSSASEDVTT